MRMPAYFSFIALACIAVMSGCTAVKNLNSANLEDEQQAKTFATKAKLANVYIYRACDQGSNPKFSVVIDAVAVGELTHCTFFRFQVLPGTHVISSIDTTPMKFAHPFSMLKGNIEAGKNYFISQQSPTLVWQAGGFTQVEEVIGKKEIGEAHMLLISNSLMYKITIAPEVAFKQRQLDAVLPNFAPQNQIIAPQPILGNRGKYMSPFTQAGTLALWSEEGAVLTDNGSDIAANVGGAIGRQIGKQVLNFVPFGLGGYLGNMLGEEAGRATTRSQIPPRPPALEAVHASSKISFNSLDDLAVYMYVKNSSHLEYTRVLALTKELYPEYKQVYVDAIVKASKNKLRKS